VSYDYSLFEAPGPGPMSSWPADTLAVLGTAEEIQRRLAEIYPQATWKASGEGWFGQAEPPPANSIEFQLTPDDDGRFRSLTVRRVTREQVADLCRALALVAVDAQTCELIRP
jgi:hypothetical protein